MNVAMRLSVNICIYKHVCKYVSIDVDILRISNNAMYFYLNILIYEYIYTNSYIFFSLKNSLTVELLKKRHIESNPKKYSIRQTTAMNQILMAAAAAAAAPQTARLFYIWLDMLFS